MSYWDTSALGKLYFPEADSTVFAQKAANLAVIVTARLALYEMRRVAFRKEAEGLIPVNAADAVLSQLDRDIVAGDIQLLEMDNRIEAEFGAIMAHCYTSHSNQASAGVRPSEARNCAIHRPANRP